MSNLFYNRPCGMKVTKVFQLLLENCASTLQADPSSVYICF